MRAPWVSGPWPENPTNLKLVEGAII
jgi:hypothetical protein